MKIALAQTNPIIGDVQRNIENHISLIEQARVYAPDMIIFPELSLTGYAPELAAELATELQNKPFELLQNLSNTTGISIGVGMPIRGGEGIRICLLWFRPQLPLQVFPKRYLHVDEEPFFVCGKEPFRLLREEPATALGICYEISVDAHFTEVRSSAAEIYIASVVKSVEGIAKAHQRLSNIAREIKVPVLMVNSIGHEDGAVSGGRSAAWNYRGELIAELEADKQGLLVIDTVRERFSTRLTGSTG